MPIPYPNLEQREEDRLAAEAIARVSGGLTADIVNAQIADRRALLPLIDAGLDTPICPELTNANPSSPHTVLLEAIAWLLAQQAYQLNQVPEQNFIAFANLFGIEQRAAAPSETVLTFTVDAPLNIAVTIPEGTQITSADGVYVFETTEAVTIPYGTESGHPAAQRTESGHTLLSPNVLTELIDPIAFVETVTNASAIDSGSELESVESVLNRVNLYQRRGERIVSVKDLEDAILNEAMNGNGVVRAFPFVINGTFDGTLTPGYTTVVVMTKTGDRIDDLTEQKIAALLDEAVGNQFIYPVPPTFVEFDVTATIKLNTGSPEGAVLAVVEANLRNFYAASRAQFGRPILRSEIIAVIEGTGGVDRIVVAQGAPILAAPLVDTTLASHELPKLVEVNLGVI
jgi:uncharacterized phage protein gp47/JayE